jgi:hypothetical protein
VRERYPIKGKAALLRGSLHFKSGFKAISA